jgi:hypothetical protein
MLQVMLTSLATGELELQSQTVTIFFDPVQTENLAAQMIQDVTSGAAKAVFVTTQAQKLQRSVQPESIIQGTNKPAPSE